MISEHLFIWHVVSTFFMTGLIWLVQIVNYPLFAAIVPSSFLQYYPRHVWRITVVVALPMLVEAITSALILHYPLASIPAWLLIINFGCVFCVWLMTLFFLVGQHHRLMSGFDAATHQKLVWSNAVRTFFWTAHAGCVVAMLYIYLT